MIVIYFIYGLAFFSMGLVLAIYPKKSSAFRMAGSLHFVAAFGILHGLNEWVDMLIFIQKSEVLLLQASKMLLLATSYLCLFQFAIKSILEKKNRYSLLRAVPIILLITWASIVMGSSHRFLMADIWARYLFGIPGIFLTGYALILQISALKDIGLSKSIWFLTISAGAFFFYCFFGGMIVPEAGFFPASVLNETIFFENVGIPIQIFRAFCAMVIAFSMVKVLGIFEWEVKERREKLIIELQDALAKIRTLRGLLPICAWCKKIRDDKGYWAQVEVYIGNHSDATFTHGICPECLEKVKEEEEEEEEE
jgi:hypothetical protein